MGTQGGYIPQVGEALSLPDPASELCSPVGPPGVPVGRNGIGFPASIPLSLEGEVGEGSLVEFPAQVCCGAVAC